MRKVALFFIGMLMFLAIPNTIRAVTCEECWDFYQGLRYNGFSDAECKEGAIMWNSECRECFYGSDTNSGDTSSSSSGGSGGCCGASALMILAFCGVFIVYYGKRHQMKR
jgi:hypothetical protein